jgi:hypothetical protein
VAAAEAATHGAEHVEERENTEAVAASDASSSSEPPQAAAPPLEWDEGRYTTAIDEPDWLAEEDWASDVPAPAEALVGQAIDAGAGAEANPTETVGQDTEAAVEPAGAPAAEAAPAEPPPAESEPSEDAASDDDAPTASSWPPSRQRAGDEETVLWFGSSPADEPSGASEMEVAGTASPAPQSSREATQAPEPRAPQARALPGTADLDDALAALRASSASQRPTPAPRTVPDAPSSAPVRQNPPYASPRPGSGAGTVMPHGPATRAYRRLRRIFPG